MKKRVSGFVYLFELNHTINREKGMMTNIFVCTVIYSSIIKYTYLYAEFANRFVKTKHELRRGEREIIAFKSRSKVEKNVLSKTKNSLVC